MGSKKSILVVCDYFVPGYRAGGPVKSIFNLLCALSGEFSFLVFSRDRDLGDRHRYSDQRQAAVVNQAPFAILYASGSLFSLSYLKVLRRMKYDAIYLNSFFSPWQTLRYFVYRKLRMVPRVPILLAPRGEFATGALGIKRFKKAMYLFLTKDLLFTEQSTVIWHASTPYEADDIKRMRLLGRRVVNAGNSTRVAADVAGIHEVCDERRGETNQFVRSGKKKEGALKIVFLSRVCKVKNLLFAIQVVRKLRCTVQFDIYGPMEDRSYWSLCQDAMRDVVPGIQIAYHGGVQPSRVSEIFKRYHVMLLPTEGENYGHVIVEALLAGCPVIISRTTPWRDLREHNAGEDCPLGDEAAFINALSRFAAMDEAQLRESSAAALRYALERCRIDEVVEANRVMLNELVGIAHS